MSDPESARTARRALFDGLLAGGLGLVLLVASAAQQMRLMRGLSTDWGQLSRLLGLHLGSTPLGIEVANFVAWQVALHVAFGLVAFALAWLTVIAFDLGPLRRRR